MRLYLSVSSGKTTCSECGKWMTKGEKQVTAQGYRSSGRFHIKCVKKILKG
jgi:hypothetical protein